MPGFHHVEVWVADLAAARRDWGWLLSGLGFERVQEWPEGESWEGGGTYLSLTTSPNLSAAEHDRRRPGVNHLAFRGGSPQSVDALMAQAPDHGWRPLYQERYPHAGGRSTTPAGWRTPPASRPRWSPTGDPAGSCGWGVRRGVGPPLVLGSLVCPHGSAGPPHRLPAGR